MSTDITVVSTGWKSPTKRLCLASVEAQVGVDVEHRWIDASTQTNPKTCSENLRHIIRALPAGRVVAWVDLDDWLAHPRALERVMQEHRAGALVTYGQFMTADGEKGFAEKYYTDHPRNEPWKATHLKTFRAGLFQRIQPDDLLVEGEPISRAVDVAVMLPMLEMARQRAVFIPDVLYVYNYSSSFEAAATEDQRREEKRIESLVRKKRWYAPFPGELPCG